MRKNNLNLRILFFILLSIVMIKTNAQIGLNFQGVARTTNNLILASQAITIKLSILQGSATGTADYTETRKVTTNAQGLFTAVIGDTGAISTLGNFTTINWKLSPKFLKIEMDAAAGTNFITMGTTQFQYVAYAQFAKSVDAENIVGIVPVTLGGTGVASIAGLKTALTLNNVNNTTDLSKPISTLTQTALDLKLNAADTSKFTKQTWVDSALVSKLKVTDTANLSARIDAKANIDSVNFVKDITVNGLKLGVGAANIERNTVFGYQALNSNTTGEQNLALGYLALNKNTTGGFNTATGFNSLYSNVDGIKNSAFGRESLLSNTAGNFNTAIGEGTLSNNTTGSANTSVGEGSLHYNIAGLNNTAVGVSSLYANNGDGNAAFGRQTLLTNTTGNENTAIGSMALRANTIGNYNTAVGYAALMDNITYSNSTGIGYNAQVTGNNQIQLGNSSVTDVITSGAITAPSFNGTLNGNATTATKAGTSSSATKLATSRNINGVAFDGSGDITVTADAGTLSGTTLKSTITGSSLTSVGTLTNTTVNGKLVVGVSSAASASAVLEASSTTQGFLPPRMTRAQRNAITTPASGLVVWCNNCGAVGELQVYSENATWTNLSGTAAAGVYTPTIGQTYQGGIVAYVLVSTDSGYDATTPHGLIAATSDQSSGIRWYNGSSTTIGVTGTAIGTGLSNTNTIITSQGGTTTSYAAGLARAYTGGGYTDWYLPSKDELAKLYAMKLLGFGGFALNFYWSSTEYDGNAAWGQNFSNGSQYGHLKISIDYVRAIRAF